ncbi:MAG TPA: hypothetical protein VNW98_03940 [Burkholderiaceae bacterium]|jgi:hypothetical protein|nr:hypothetical protein [Burkholderiaceae bacterium]
MTTSRPARHISFAAAALAATVSMGAHAEYRCNGQPLPEEKRACELAKQGPDELRRFVDRTRGIYGLYFYDYLSEEDASRWHGARHGVPAQPVAASDARTKDQKIN